MPKPQVKTPKSLSVDFTGIERGGGGSNPRLPEGDYLARVVGCELRTKKDDPSKKHLLWKLQITDGNKRGVGKSFNHRTGLSNESLWSLRGFLMDLLGADKVPQRAVDIPIEAIVKKQPSLGITIEDDDYNGKETSKISATFPKADWASLKGAATADDEEDEEDEEDEDEEEEEEAPKAKKSKKSKKPVVEEDDEEDEDDEDELEVDEL